MWKTSSVAVQIFYVFLLRVEDKKAVLPQGEPRDAAVNFETEILQ